MNISQKKIAQLQHKILSHYAQNKRDLPWRRRTDPYHILVSEIMLQQTQVSRVIPLYENFIKQFPTLQNLAKADKRPLLQAWQGLGYNSRALRLQKLAQQVTTIPKTRSELLELPGIGPYTSTSILAFAFNAPVPVVDTNIRRILIHELNLPEDLSQEALEFVAAQCIPENRSAEWHNALMDYGSQILTAKATGIKPLSQQSKFQGSTRQVRGQIIRELTQKQHVHKETIQKQYPHPEFNAILQKLKHEGIITTTNNTIKLA